MAIMTAPGPRTPALGLSCHTLFFFFLHVSKFSPFSFSEKPEAPSALVAFWK